MRLLDIPDASDADILHVCRNMREWDVKEINAGRWGDDPADLARDIRAWRKHGVGWVAGTAEPIAILGSMQLWPGVWSCWMFATSKISAVGLPLTRFARHSIVPGLKRHGAHRLEARSMVGHEDAHRWLRALGGQPEATLRGYGKGGEDFIVFTILREVD